MKRTLTFIFSVAVCLAVSLWECPAQDYVATPVTVSKDKVKQNGKLYYSHVVLQRQTLFSIAKAYGVTVDEIYAANPGLEESGLRTNGIILVPTESSEAAAGSQATESKTSKRSSGGSARSAGTKNAGNGASAEAVAADGSDNGGSDAAEASAGKASSTKKNTKDYFIHTVKWYEDIDMISEKYGVSTAIIMDFNSLTSRKLKAKQKLMIPTNPEDYDLTGSALAAGAKTSSGGKDGRNNSQNEGGGLTYSAGDTGAQASAQTASGNPETAYENPETTYVNPENPNGNPETEPSASGTASGRRPLYGGSVAGSNSAWGGGIASEGGAGIPTFRRGDKVSATLLLPFNATSDESNELSMDFYSGALLAARNLASEGVDIELNAYDSYGDILPLTAGELTSSDIVIGLMSTGGFTSLLNAVPQGTYVVSPLDYRSEQLARDNANFISTANSTAAQYEDLARWISEEIAPEDKVVVIYEGNAAGTQLKDYLSEILSHYSYPWSSFSYTILQGRSVTGKLESLFTEEGMNRILIASENESFVNDVIRNLNLLIHSKYNITLYGGSRIRGFENVDVANLHNTNFHSSLSFYIDYDDPKVRQFLMQYRALYNTEPSQTAFQGYDTMYYFSNMARRFGQDMGERIAGYRSSMLMSDFEFERSGAGLVRTAVRRIVYEPDYSVTYLR